MMHAALAGGADLAEAATIHRRPPPRTPAPAVDPGPATPADEGFAAGRRPNLGVLAFIAALHAAGLFALVKLDIVSLPKARHEPLVVQLIAEPPAPPPVQAPPETKVETIKPRETPIVAPPPIVAVPVQPQPIATVPETLAPQAIAVAPPQAAPGPAAPITPPDASAASLRNPAPRYPIESRRKREEGTVRLRVVITVDGRVKEIGVARSSGFDRLDDAALDAVRRWKFRPGMQAGTPVEAIGFLSIPFKIAD